MIEKIVLIADSGATKTDWAIIDFENEPKIVQTIGFNPYFIDTEGIYEELDKNLYPYLNNSLVREVYFYGAGCSNPTNCGTVKYALEDFFKNATELSVEHDLMGAAKALFGKEKGIVSILGTGSNSCLYDGSEIIENVPSLGFVLADEGSGAYMGKLLIRDYFFGKLPEKVKNAFDEKYQTSLERILDEVYNKPRPNRYMASFTHFLSDNIDDPHIKGIVKKSFIDFFEVQVIKYTNYKNIPLSAVGSVAFHFQKVLQEVASDYGVEITKVLQSPMEGLIEFHS
jgi:N-acetylglucosamine kinase-like BadF-type ATPase